MILPTVLLDSIQRAAVSVFEGHSAHQMQQIDGRWFTAAPLRPFIAKWDTRPRIVGAWRVLTGRAFAVQFAGNMPPRERAAWCDRMDSAA